MSVELQQGIDRWFIGFHGRETQMLVDHISPPGWRHCLCFAFHAQSRVWCIYDVTERRTLIYTLEPALFRVWLDRMKDHHGMRVLAVTPAEDGPTLWSRFALYCVTAVKHVIGSRSRALRPIALWRDLLAAGAVEAFKDEANAEKKETVSS